MKVIVESAGGHTHPIPKGTDELIKALLIECGFAETSEWIVVHGPVVKGKASMPAIKVLDLDSGHSSIRLRTKPGNNTTARICYLRPPTGSGILLEDLYDKIKGRNGFVLPPLVTSAVKNRSNLVTKESSQANSAELAKFLSNQVCLHGLLSTLWPDGYLEDKLQVDEIRSAIGIASGLELSWAQLVQASKKLIDLDFIAKVPKSGGKEVRLGVVGKKLLDGAGEIQKIVKVEPRPVVLASPDPSPAKEDAKVDLTAEQMMLVEISGLEKKLSLIEAEKEALEEKARPDRERLEKLQRALAVLRG
ncbi:MAG: hypothetical protein A2571_02300 [Candidatus Vogelbacteria bacterium RIFOXYD1_FULL_44_32]|uniref:Uncharacterized protein n=1 Tax=Candidatus Vogelbacteria bacterium RIFOXYD1_FULL_44_32 TaxID=1802438 RepID=A0A1G2QDP7_9BACT|nr:MAG: hypothetical protein A2571_02300 [Candidatus Vogelbacteria bacterium RIFOXYD1_FULL_44_32]